MTFTIDDELGNPIELKPNGSNISVTEYNFISFSIKNIKKIYFLNKKIKIKQIRVYTVIFRFQIKQINKKSSWSFLLRTVASNKCRVVKHVQS